MKQATEKVCPPVIIWLWKEQRRIKGPVPESDVAKYLGVTIRELPQAVIAIKRMGFVFDRVMFTAKVGGTWVVRGSGFYTGRVTIAEMAPKASPDCPRCRAAARPKGA